MARLDLHVGGHRTGSTSVQATMAASRDVLARTGLVYPDNVSGATHRLGCSLAHHHLAEAGRALGRHLAAIRAHYGEADYLLSSETFENTTLPERRAIVATLREHFDAARIVYYLREPVSLAVSKAARQIKTGRRSFAAIAADPPVPQLRRQVADWIEAAGAADVVLRVYDRALLAGGDVVDDLLAVAGRDAARLALVRRDANASISMAQALARSAAIEQRAPEVHHRTWRRLREVDDRGPRFTLPRAALEAVAAATAADVAWLRETHGIAFPPSRIVPFEALDLTPPSAWQRLKRRLSFAAG